MATVRTFPYPGSKQRYSDWIIDHLPDHTCYVEPFGGAAGVLVNKEPSQIEVYNDIDGDLVHFFEVLRERPGELKEWLERVPYARELYEEWATEYYDGYRPNDDIERAGRWFWLRYTQFGGKYESKAGFGISKDPSNSQVRRYRTGISELGMLADRFANVLVENLDWLEVIDRYDRETTVFYFDPPYNGSEDIYNAEGFDHERLRDTLQDIGGYAVVSYDHQIDWGGWNVVSRKSGYKIANVNGEGRKEMTEYLAMNFDPEQTEMFKPENQSSMDRFQ